VVWNWRGGFGIASGGLAPSSDLEAFAGLLPPPSLCFFTNKALGPLFFEKAKISIS